MKVVGIQIKSSEAILVVLDKNEKGVITQQKQSTKFGIKDPTDSVQVRQFRDQINATLDSIKPDKIGILTRQHRGKMASSPISFKLEGIIQLYEKAPLEFISPQTTSAYFKKSEATTTASQVQQKDAFEVAYLLINK
jgi:hypothetical protein